MASTVRTYASDDLRALRETFRARMREVDFCLGETEVEKLFRELLGEPEPTPRRESVDAATALRMEQLEGAVKAILLPQIERMFTADSALMSTLKRRR